MKVLILVLSSRNDKYQLMIDTIKETWGSNKQENVDIIYYFGNNNKTEMIDNNLYLTTSEKHSMMGPRTLNAFEYLINEDFDYIFRVNAGCYIRQDILLEFLKNKPRENFYSGIIGNYMGITYCSGSGYFLSKDIVKKLVKDKNNLRLYYSNGQNCVDDVAVGEMITRFGVKPDLNAIRLSICDGKNEYQIGDKTVSNIDDGKIYHYRLRSNNRYDDINNMHLLHKKYRM